MTTCPFAPPFPVCVQSHSAAFWGQVSYPTLEGLYESPAGEPARFRKTQPLFAVTVPALVILLSITGFVWAQKDVTVIVDGDARRLSTQAIDVAGALRDAGVEVGTRDIVTPAPDTELGDGDTIVVRHAIPLTLEASGESIELAVVGKTVADALVAAGMDPSDNAGVSPSLDAPLEAGMTIMAPRTVVRVLEERIVVRRSTVKKRDPGLSRGRREVVVEGRNGKALRVYRTLVTDGVEGQRILVSERVVARPVDRVIAVGSASGPKAARVRADRAFSSRSSGRAAKGRHMAVSATAYSPGSDGVDWRTATGARAGLGVIAVDPRVIPLGTRIFVPGYGYGVAADTGGAIKGARIDVCFENRSDALRWGRRNVSIVLLD